MHIGLHSTQSNLSFSTSSAKNNGILQADVCSILKAGLEKACRFAGAG